MSIAPQLPHRIDLLREIPKLVEPFCVVLGKFPFSKRLKQIDRRSVELLWGFIHTFQGGRYRYHDFHPSEDPHGRGLYFERRQEAAEVTRAAFIAAFGRGPLCLYDEKTCRELVLEVLASVLKGTSFTEAEFNRVERFIFTLSLSAEEKILLPVVSMSESPSPDTMLALSGA